ncbi:MAG: polysaccharide biosynthesis tyrosine autokinase [Planctomycetales bacterium]|nr:polysaccharide biosynthesis tyrosine autokinase [Planctomycetales bacterium]
MHANDSNESSRSHAAQAIREMLRFSRVVMRHLHVILITVILGGVAGGLKIASERAKPLEFESSATLLMERLNSPGDNGVFQTSTPLENYRQVLVSDRVLATVLERVSNLPPEIDQSRPRESWARQLRELILIKGQGSSGLVDVVCSSKNQDVPATIINHMIEEAQNTLDQSQENLSMEFVKTLDEERKQLEKRLTTSEQQLLQMQQSIGAFISDGSGGMTHPQIKRALELNNSYLLAQKRRIELEAMLVTIQQTVQQGGSLVPHLRPLEELLGPKHLSTVLALPKEEDTDELEQQLLADQEELANAMQFYGEAHPRVQKLQRAIAQKRLVLEDGMMMAQSGEAAEASREAVDRLLSILQNSIEAERTREDSLFAVYRAAESEAVSVNSKLAQTAILQREAELLRETHSNFLNRLESIEVRPNRTQVRLTVLNEPQTLGEPKVRLSFVKIMVFALAAGMAVGLVAIYVLDLLDDRFRSPDDLTGQTGLQLLSVIPEMPVAGEGESAFHVGLGKTDARSEAFRTLRTVICMSGENRERIAVSSSEPQDGKTTVLANVGASFALTGKRTLLIDADLRNPGLSKLLKMKSPGGLTEVLRSHHDVAETAAEFVRETHIQNLYVLPCGTRPSNPSELLSSARFAEFVAWAEANYDQILIDSPPVGVASDAALIGRQVDGLVLVVQPKKNRRQLVLRTCESIKNVGITILGIVANRISEDHEDSYGYGGRYGYGYGYGYGQHDDPSDGDVDGDTRAA